MRQGFLSMYEYNSEWVFLKINLMLGYVLIHRFVIYLNINLYTFIYT